MTFSQKMQKEVQQLDVNNLVRIVDENVKRTHYKMGRVLEVYHGSDGRVRAALVKAEVGKFKRPVVKLAPMFYESVFGRETGPATLAPVIISHRKSIWNMVVEKQELEHFIT